MNLSQLKNAVEKLSPADRAKFISWCVSYHEKAEIKVLSDCKNGIQHTEVLGKFRELFEQPERGREASAACDNGAISMLEFYRDTRVKRCPFAADADMLLYQWGRVPSERAFSLSFVRQLIPQTRNPEIWQLEVAYYYPLNALTKSLGEGNQWCRSLDRPELGKFQAFIRTWKALDELRFERPVKSELRYERV